MLEYLFDKDYRNAKNRCNNAKSKIKKLNKIKDDITNDSSSINSINHRIDYINEDFAKAIRVSDVRRRVSSKLNSLKEPYQTSDGNLKTACDYIDNENAILQRQVNSAQSEMNTIKNQTNGSW